ncbi:Xyloglucan 6-xylosyltransferase [Arachis hypogaea]|nr:Xyloglucan 6-xylosyltransferase [Arachis hypogaea]
MKMRGTMMMLFSLRILTTYWAGLVDRYEEMVEKYHPGFGVRKRKGRWRRGGGEGEEDGFVGVKDGVDGEGASVEEEGARVGFEE